MTIRIDLAPDIEQELRAQADASGVSVADYVEQIVKRAARSRGVSSGVQSGRSLVEASAKVRGLLTDEEVDTLFARNRSESRPVNVE